MSYNPEWNEYYVFLEILRKSGETNMYGAGSYLKRAFPELGTGVISSATTVLTSWMDNYDELIEDGVIGS